MIWEYVDSIQTKDRLKELDITNDTIKDRIYKYYENFIHCKICFLCALFIFFSCKLLSWTLHDDGHYFVVQIMCVITSLR